MYNKLQYISQGTTVEDQLHNINNALDHGCDWVQLRFKNAPEKELFRLGEAVKFLCEEYLANFIVNDDVYLAQHLAADGVHLGMSDMSVITARHLLGKTKIIGGTANTFEEVLQRAKEGCDYIGLGPYKHTNTKTNLSPTLGLQGYHNLLQQMQSNKIDIPVFAIGGIKLDDISPLMQTGIHGIAISSLLTNTANTSKLIVQLHEKLHVNI
jgi:thiamine-phosphate pyrophosphorylase